MLEILLEKKVMNVTVHAEHALLYNSENRSIRLDVFAQNDSGDYNVEMQGENKGNLPKRSRFHQAEMDVASIMPGSDFNELKPSYVIFICTFDPFGKGLYRYTFENRCREIDFALEDGTTKIFFNTQGKNSETVSRDVINFLSYAENNTEQCVIQLCDEKISRLHGRINTLKKSRDWENRYMRFEELLQDAEEKGQERLLRLIRKMVAAGETEMIPRLSDDTVFLQQMYEKYQV